MWNQLQGERLLQAKNCITKFLTLFRWMLPRVSHLEEPVNKIESLKEDRETVLEKNNTSVMNVGKSLVRAQPLIYIRGSTVERNLIHVTCVQSLSAEVQSWFNIEESTLGRNPSNGKAFSQSSNLFRHRKKHAGEKVPSVLWGSQSIYWELFQQGSRHKAPILL